MPTDRVSVYAFVYLNVRLSRISGVQRQTHPMSRSCQRNKIKSGGSAAEPTNKQKRKQAN